MGPAGNLPPRHQLHWKYTISTGSLAFLAKNSSKIPPAVCDNIKIDKFISRRYKQIRGNRLLRNRPWQNIRVNWVQDSCSVPSGQIRSQIDYWEKCNFSMNCLIYKKLRQDTARRQTLIHYSGVTMGTVASQITSLTIVYSTAYSGEDQREHRRSASVAFMWGIHRWPVNSPHIWTVTRKMFPFDDVIMNAYKLLWGDSITCFLKQYFRPKIVTTKIISSKSWKGDGPKSVVVTIVNQSLKINWLLISHL